MNYIVTLETENGMSLECHGRDINSVMNFIASSLVQENIVSVKCNKAV